MKPTPTVPAYELKNELVPGCPPPASGNGLVIMCRRQDKMWLTTWLESCSTDYCSFSCYMARPPEVAVKNRQARDRSLQAAWLPWPP